MQLFDVLCLSIQTCLPWRNQCILSAPVPVSHLLVRWGRWRYGLRICRVLLVLVDLGPELLRYGIPQKLHQINLKYHVTIVTIAYPKCLNDITCGTLKTPIHQQHRDANLTFFLAETFKTKKWSQLHKGDCVVKPESCPRAEPTIQQKNHKSITAV